MNVTVSQPPTAPSQTSWQVTPLGAGDSFQMNDVGGLLATAVKPSGSSTPCYCPSPDRDAGEKKPP